MAELIRLGKTEIDIIIKVHSFFKNSEKTLIWMVTKNPAFGSISPMELIQEGKSDKLLKVVVLMLDDNHAG